MSKAYQCNKCGKYHNGNADTQVGHNEDLEKLLNFMLGIKFSPGNKEAGFYIKDLCPACAKLYCELWKLSPMESVKMLRGLKSR